MTAIRPFGLVRGLVIVGALAAFPFVFNEHWLVNIGVFTLMYAALATAWNMFAGYSGYISLGHVAFFGIGAYTVANTFSVSSPLRGSAYSFTSHAFMSIGSGYRPFYVLPLVGLAVALLSVPIGWVALRTRAITFAIVTLTLLFVFQNLAFNLRGVTNGSSGLSVPTPNFPVETYERPFYFAMLGVLVLGLLLSWHIGRNKLGLMLFAIREDEEKARGLGVRTTGVKLVTFALSAGLTAMAGGVWAYYLTYIYPQFAVDPLVMIGSVVPVFLGGRGTLWGPVLGALILVPAQQYMAYRLGASELYLVGYAAVFVVILLVLPRGILPSLGDAYERWRYRGARVTVQPEEVPAA
ncbi:MAG: branched-chain amino acid ABC transporter permease [Actinobacteria bacterium]|nr:MAG: branched-chain amino acid ABC transporter permease [Actinomycetota bacterium]